MKKLTSICTILIAFNIMTSPAKAGIYSDELAKCIVEKTTDKDKINLIRWMFSAITMHPAISSLASIAEEERNTNNSNIARMFEDLLLTTCDDETTKAVKYEGAKSIEEAFSVLGQVAAQELFAHPDVTAGMAELEKHFDGEKLKGIYGVEE